ncbi:hypothetical protein [Kitasatospora sp. NPDC059673]
MRYLPAQLSVTAAALLGLSTVLVTIWPAVRRGPVAGTGARE